MTCTICDGEGTVTIKLRKFKCPQCYGNGDFVSTDTEIKQEVRKIYSINISVNNLGFNIKYGTLICNIYGDTEMSEFNEVDVIKLVSSAKK